MKRVLITGGEGGLGRALVGAFEGYQVLAPGRSDLDVRDAEQVADFLAREGEVDVLICNAGVTEDRGLGRMGEASWDRVLDVNLSGAFRCARAVAGGMVRRGGGHVILISSFSAYCPPRGQANYAASKAGLEGLGKSMAKELGGRNVRVNVVVPGFMETRMTAASSREVREAARARHILGRLNEPERAARFVRFLDEEMVHTSGQVFHLDSRVFG